MKKVYVAGAYSDDNVLSVLKNIGRGQQWASKLFMDGFAPFTPWHDKTFVIDNWKEEFTVPMFYNYSMEWLKASDAVFIVPNEPGMKNWEESHGTLKEIEMAHFHCIPVFFNYDELLEWKETGILPEKNKIKFIEI